MTRKRLCMTVPVGTSVQIGDEYVYVSHVRRYPASRGTPAYDSASMETSSGTKFVLIENSEAFFRDYSILVTEITATKVRMAIHAPESLKITRLGHEGKHNEQ